jgi:hypothetical protein
VERGEGRSSVGSVAEAAGDRIVGGLNAVHIVSLDAV